MPDPRFLCMYPKRQGPYAPEEEELFVLVDRETGVKCAHQFRNGADAFEIENERGVGFKQRPLQGKVVSPAHHLALSQSLGTGINVVGSGHTGFPYAGWDPKHGLHTRLASQPDIKERRRSDDSDRMSGVSQQTYFEIDTTHTDPLLYCHASVERTCSLGISPYGGGTVYRVHDAITALDQCNMSIINHPNPRSEIGDRLILPQTKCVLRDRDGEAQLAQHPFFGVSEEFWNRCVPERCSFGHIEPLADGFAPVLQLRQNGQGIGMRYRYVADHPFISLWYSPGGYFGLESGDLPLGTTKLSELGILKMYGKGEGWINEFEIHFLNDQAATDAFVAANRMDPTILGPEIVSWSGKDHADVISAAAAYNAEHELT